MIHKNNSITNIKMVDTEPYIQSQNIPPTLSNHKTCKNRMGQFLYYTQLPITVGLIVVPIINNEYTLNYLLVPICYFFASLIVFLNFPIIVELLHSKPLYLENLADNTPQLNRFKISYKYIMNICLAIVIGGISEYVIIQGVNSKPIVELFAILGGNMALFMKIQHIIGKSLLYLCHCFKTREIRRLSDASSPRGTPINPPISNARTSEIELIIPPLSLSDTHT